MTTSGSITIRLPEAVESNALDDTTTGFSVSAAGTGSFTGLSYTVPAHASGTLNADIQVMALTTDDVDNLNKLVMGLLSASEQDKVTSHSETNASADLSVWDIFGGGASASYSQTTDTMHSMGLTDAQITTIVGAMMAAAQKMSHVSLDFTIDNTNNDYSVSGDLELYTISGTITSGQSTSQYRMLASKGTAGQGAAPASGAVIPLS